MSHRTARLTVFGRRLLVERVRSGRPVAHVAAEIGISRATAHKRVRRWQPEGDAGPHERSSRPRTTPHRRCPAVEARVCDLRRTRERGPARIGPVLGLPASTVHRIPTRPGERKSSTPVIGCSYIHSAVDDHSRLAYSEVLPDERLHTAIGFLEEGNPATSQSCSSRP